MHNNLCNVYNEVRIDDDINNHICVSAQLGVSMGRVGSGYIILLFSLVRLESDSFKFGFKNLDTYSTRPGHESTRPDMCKIIKYLLIIFALF
jgi:hypothetical protein